MFIGHFAVALGAKRFVDSVSLGTLFIACQLADLIWPNLVLMGLETVTVDPGNTAMTPLNFEYYPVSHSLLGAVLWSLLFGGLYLIMARASPKLGIAIALVALSHWILDAITHRPDLPLTFANTTLIGLGLWNYPIAGIALELLIFAVGVFLYVRHTTPKNRKGRIGFWTLIGFLLIVYAGNLMGPPPPSGAAVAWTAQSMWLLVIWAYWVDRHREFQHRPHARSN